MSDETYNKCPVCDDPTCMFNTDYSKPGPVYYKSLSPEPIEVIEGWGLDYNLGCLLKYIARAGKKPDNTRLQDLEKAQWYLQREIDCERFKNE